MLNDEQQDPLDLIRSRNRDILLYLKKEDMMPNIDKDGSGYWKIMQIMPIYKYWKIMEELRRARIQLFWRLREEG